MECAKKLKAAQKNPRYIGSVYMKSVVRTERLYPSPKGKKKAYVWRNRISDGRESRGT